MTGSRRPYPETCPPQVHGLWRWNLSPGSCQTRSSGLSWCEHPLPHDPSTKAALPSMPSSPRWTEPPKPWKKWNLSSKLFLLGMVVTALWTQLKHTGFSPTDSTTCGSRNSTTKTPTSQETNVYYTCTSWLSSSLFCNNIIMCLHIRYYKYPETTFYILYITY